MFKQLKIICKSQRWAIVVKLRFAFKAFLLLSWILGAHAQEPQRTNIVLYPVVERATLYTKQARNFSDLLELALQRTDKEYQLQRVSVPILPHTRSSSLIQQGIYDIHWLATSKEREEKLKPIRIPLLRGLLGLRIALINSKTPNLLGQISDLNELQRLYVGQGHDWIDTQVLDAHQFRVVTSSTTESLFNMLEQGRIDYFPRSITEAWYEQEFFNSKNISVDQHIAIYYPLPMYFFVRKSDDILHQQIQLGLERAIADGSFQRKFEEYFQHYIERANLEKRKVFKLNNPYIPKETPLARAELWLQLPDNVR